VIGTLHVGDEIQDINGCCVDGQSLDSLQTLLVCGFTCCIVSNVCIRVQRSDRPRRDGLQTKLYPKWVYEGSNYEKVLCAINVSFAYRLNYVFNVIYTIMSCFVSLQLACDVMCFSCIGYLVISHQN